MIHLEDFLWGFSIVSLFLYFLQSLRRAISMASLCLSSPSSSSSSLASTSPSWVQFVLGRREEDGTVSGDVNLLHDHETQIEEKSMQENLGLDDKFLQEINPAGFLLVKESDSLVMEKAAAENNNKNKSSTKLKKRPARLVLPEYYPKLEFGEKDRKLENMEFQVKGRDFCLASKKGRRQCMEDGYGVMTDILGDTKQVYNFFFFGH